MLVGGWALPLWKMMEFVNGFRMTSPYMKWKIKSCLKPQTRMSPSHHQHCKLGASKKWGATSCPTLRWFYWTSPEVFNHMENRLIIRFHQTFHGEIPNKWGFEWESHLQNARFPAMFEDTWTWSRPCICCWLHSWLRCGRSYSGGPSRCKVGTSLKSHENLGDPILRPEDENG